MLEPLTTRVSKTSNEFQLASYNEGRTPQSANQKSTENSRPRNGDGHLGPGHGRVNHILAQLTFPIITDIQPRKYPSAQVIGNDISAIQPNWVAPNVEFIVDDYEAEWLYQKDNFDFIHARLLSGYALPHRYSPQPQR